MDVRKLAVGGAFLFAGIIVPVLQHALIYIGAGAAANRGISPNNFHILALQDFSNMPPLVSLYFGVMWLVGIILILGGLFTKPETHAATPMQL